MIRANVRADAPDAKVGIQVSGRDGYTPRRGVDYWTEEDKQEIRDYVDEQVGDIQPGESKPPLAGTTDEITPLQALTALNEGREVVIGYIHGYYGRLVFMYFFYAADLRLLVSSGTFALENEVATCQLVGNAADNTWRLDIVPLAKTADLPSALPNPYRLVIPTEDGSNYYDGSAGKTVRIPEAYTLPTASADKKGGVKIGEGLEMDGETLRVEPESVYELIETITVTEESTIVRTAEPSGMPYNFEAMFVEIQSTLEAFNGFNAYFEFENGESFPMWVEKYSGNTALNKKIAYLEVAKQYGLYHARYRPHTTNNYITNLQESVHAECNGGITAFKVANAPSAGTTFNIWGVRANA